MKNNLKRIRRNKHLEQSDVARDLGISLSTYRSWEQGVRGLNDEKLVMFVEYFGVSSDEILGTSAAFNTASSSRLAGERELLDAYRSLSQSGQETARTVITALLCSEKEHAEANH